MLQEESFSKPSMLRNPPDTEQLRTGVRTCTVCCLFYAPTQQAVFLGKIMDVYYKDTNATQYAQDARHRSAWFFV